MAVLAAVHMQHQGWKHRLISAGGGSCGACSGNRAGRQPRGSKSGPRNNRPFSVTDHPSKGRLFVLASDGALIDPYGPGPGRCAIAKGRRRWWVQHGD